MVLSLIPSAPKIDLDQGDKLEHFAAYGLLMFLFCQIYAREKTRIVYALAFVAMGIALEFLQGMTPTRTFDVMDMLANTIGVGLGWLAGALFEKHARIRR